jgi:hypothetical protein
MALVAVIEEKEQNGLLGFGKLSMTQQEGMVFNPSKFTEA